MEPEGSLPCSQEPAHHLSQSPLPRKYRYFSKILIKCDGLFSKYIDVCTDKTAADAHLEGQILIREPTLNVGK
jgi:hypothetical protein